MATMRATVPELAPMMVAQISKPGTDFEIIKREFLSRVQDKCGSGAACGVCHSDAFTKEAMARHSVSRVPRNTKWWANIDEWALAFPNGRKESAWASAGTEATTIRVANAGAEIFVIAGIESSGHQL